MANSTAESSPQYENLAAALQTAGLNWEALTPVVIEQIQNFVFFSPRLAAIGGVHPEYILPLLQEAPIKRIDRNEMKQQLQSFMENEDDKEAAIRKFHRQEIIRIAWRDLGDCGEIQEITEEISDLAETVVQAVFSIVWDSLTKKYGEPHSEEEGSPASLCVVGMGKLGGRELNFSSDIDLMFVYRSEGKTKSASAPSVSNRTFFTQLAQGICDMLGKMTPEGFLYRVDARLRPEGDRGALAVSLAAVEAYYHNYGQNWERQALLKARAIAGDADIGRQFMSVITPFTYRKYVDEVEIADVLLSIDRMRNKYLSQLASPEEKANDFKNGYGGIRDIEFFVQAVQMLYGGQYPEIKLAGTLLSLKRMHESHLLHSKDFGPLDAAYRFLRRIEHRMQMVGDRQIYELPKDEEGRRRLAESMGINTFEDLKKQYDRYRAGVRRIYEGVFKREEWRDPSEIILESGKFDERSEKILRDCEFENPKKAHTFLHALNQSPDAHLQPKTTRLFKALLPRLLLCLKNSPDTDLALSNFEKLASSFKARSALYQTLCDQPALVDLLVSVVSCSSFLTSLVLRDPSLMEAIGRDGVFEEIVSKESLANHLRIIAKTYPAKNRREHLLFVQNAAMLRSGIRFLLGFTDVERMGVELADIADFVLEHSLTPVNETLACRFPDFVRAHSHEIAVVGFGKLGGREFNVASDCDLVFIYPETVSSEKISSTEFFQRWAAEYGRFLESKTYMGFLYHADMRLRPFGNSSPMASSQDAFAKYYRTQALFWEKMALTRARFICGNPQIADFLDRIKNEILFSRSCVKEEIEAILSMRQKIEKEKSKETLKAGPGGLVDVEFIAQALVLHYGHSHPSLRTTSTLEALRQAQEAGRLSRSDAAHLIASYLFLREVENRLRIVNNVSLDSLPQERHELEKLTRRYALRLDAHKPTPDIFLGMISLHTHRVREIFDQFFHRLLEEASA
ncbi:MAG: bifunctional [glutamate--ammonia ligase]-adenylyl-L-tyrosine phosphorylase/[glutamate--ammonia-ligase] adenylyltransferase [Candidatus Omnitrophota bacterium]